MGRTFCCRGQHNNHHQRAFHVHFGDSTKEITFASGLASDRCAGINLRVVGGWDFRKAKGGIRAGLGSCVAIQASDSGQAVWILRKVALFLPVC